MPKPTSSAIVAIPTRHTGLLLVCRKCSKKLDGGFGPTGNDTLARALKREFRSASTRQAVRIVETKCLGLCPRRAVTILSSRAPGTLLAVPQRTDPAAVIAALPPPP